VNWPRELIQVKTIQEIKASFNLSQVPIGTAVLAKEREDKWGQGQRKFARWGNQKTRPASTSLSLSL